MDTEFERTLLAMIDAFLDGELEFETFRRAYCEQYVSFMGRAESRVYDHALPIATWLDVHSDEMAGNVEIALPRERRQFFQTINERVEWTMSEEPDAVDRRCGWRTVDEFIPDLTDARNWYHGQFGR